MLAIIMESRVAGCNGAVSPLAGIAEREEKKSIKDTGGTYSAWQGEL